ncbi:MAG: universal stress protein [Deltaproteobacteria bacterium]|nr:universal stress protein [Deltaproteobacteria bacterium]
MTLPLWLVPHDLSDVSNAAAAEAARMATASGGRLFLLNVHPREERAPFERDGKETWAIEEEKRAMLRMVSDRLRAAHPGLQVDVEVLPGDPQARILEEADRLGATHIVVGTHDRKGLERLVLGSVAEAVVHRASIPVVVVKAPALH